MAQTLVALITLGHVVTCLVRPSLAAWFCPSYNNIGVEGVAYRQSTRGQTGTQTITVG
jgi:hypothetical protein